MVVAFFGSVLSRGKKEVRNRLKKRVRKKEGRKRGRTKEGGEESQQDVQTPIFAVDNWRILFSRRLQPGLRCCSLLLSPRCC